MKKMIFAASVFASLALLTGCSNGIEKEYKLEVQEIVQVKDEEGKIKHAAHCKKALSILKYYVLLPEGTSPLLADLTGTEKFDYSVLVAKDTGEKTEFKLVSDSSSVSDHGYKFVRWEAKE